MPAYAGHVLRLVGQRQIIPPYMRPALLSICLRRCPCPHRRPYAR